MPGGETNFSAAWLSSVYNNGQKISEWCHKWKDDYHGYCHFCNTDIRCNNADKAQLLQHTAKKKHKEAIQHSQDNKQTKLLFHVIQAGQSSSTASTDKPNVLINYGDTSLKGHIYWLAKMACNNYSLWSSDHIGYLFWTMFPDSKIAANFNLSCTGASYMTGEGLSLRYSNFF